jgi:hypothetical protein
VIAEILAEYRFDNTHDPMNPYDPPLATLPDDTMSVQHQDDKPNRNHFIVWPIVFALNLIVPLLFGGSMLRERGMIGLSVAVAFFLIAGWYICYMSPFISIRLLVGAGITAISQLFPIIHVLAGLIAVATLSKLGLATDENDVGIGTISSEAGGFMMTMITGSIIAAFALIVGFLVMLLGGGIKSMWNRGTQVSPSPPLDLK